MSSADQSRAYSGYYQAQARVPILKDDTKLCLALIRVGLGPQYSAALPGGRDLGGARDKEIVVDTDADETIAKGWATAFSEALSSAGDLSVMLGPDKEMRTGSYRRMSEAAWEAFSQQARQLDEREFVNELIFYPPTVKSAGETRKPLTAAAMGSHIYRGFEDCKELQTAYDRALAEQAASALVDAGSTGTSQPGGSVVAVPQEWKVKSSANAQDGSFILSPGETVKVRAQKENGLWEVERKDGMKGWVLADCLDDEGE